MDEKAEPRGEPSKTAPLGVGQFPMRDVTHMKEPNSTEIDRIKGIKKLCDLERYTEVQTWLRTVSPRTVRGYLKVLEKFCNWCGKTPHELILLRDQERNEPDPNKRTVTKNLILDFRLFLEKEGYAPKTINAMDGAIRGFFTAVLGREGMINVGNYSDRDVSKTKDLVPTLEEVRRMIDVSDISVKFRIIFLAQTIMRPEDALKQRVGDTQRELDLGKCPLAIRFLPEKDRNRGVGERITFLGKDGIDILKQYLDWRRRSGEIITPDSPLFVGRSRKYNGKTVEVLTKRMMNESIKEAARKAGVGDSDGKYGRMREYCLRKFAITQMTNHGVQDTVVDFMSCHKVSPVDLVYWSRRVEELREIYRQREKYLNPISGTQSIPPPEEIDKRIVARIKEFIQSQEFREVCGEVVQNLLGEHGNNKYYESAIVRTEDEVLKLANEGYDCQTIGENTWLMKRPANGKFNFH